MKNYLLLVFFLFFLSFAFCEELPAPDDWSDVDLSDNASSADAWSDVNLSNDSLSDAWSDVELSDSEINDSSLQEEVSSDLPNVQEAASSSKYSNVNKKIVNLVTTGNIYGVKTGAYYFALVMAGVFFFILALLIYLVFFKH